jgi:ABC-type phosphate/phosphonate transport system substrate-binding protein
VITSRARLTTCYFRGISTILFLLIIVGQMFLMEAYGEDRAMELKLLLPPNLSQAEQSTMFNPILGYLRQKTGVRIQLLIAPSHLAVGLMLRRQDVDLALIDAEQYQKISALNGKYPLIAQIQQAGSTKRAGVIVVKKGGPIKELKDLAGKRFIFGPVGSQLGDIIPCEALGRALTKGKFALKSYLFLNSYHNIALQVVTGMVDAGVLDMVAFKQVQSLGIESLWRSKPISTRLLVGSKKLSPKLFSSLQQALINLHQDPFSAVILSSLKSSVTGFVMPTNNSQQNRGMSQQHTRCR